MSKVTQVTQIGRATASPRVHCRRSDAVIAQVLKRTSRKATACEEGGTSHCTPQTVSVQTGLPIDPLANHWTRSRRNERIHTHCQGYAWPGPGTEVRRLSLRDGDVEHRRFHRPGLITALFIPTGWLPNAKVAALFGPMIGTLLPLLIGYTGGRTVHGQTNLLVGGGLVAAPAPGSIFAYAAMIARWPAQDDVGQLVAPVAGSSHPNASKKERPQPDRRRS